MKRMQAGDTIGQYRVIRLLGAGGMGSVYEAEDTRLGRHVALKLLSGALLENQLAVERFRREARAVSALNHPHICTLHDVGEFDGHRFLVLELLNGETLEARLRTGPVPQNEIYKIAMHVADGLAAAHAAGIVHRDLKPANIFITSRGDAKVLDFGLAKIIPTAGPDDSTLAMDGLLSTPHSVAGTIAYMSPEQVRGDVLDARTDLFSFGVVLYEMVTSRTPFPGVTIAMVFDAILHQEPDPPRNVNPPVSPELQRIILKALDKDRTRRYQSATDLLTDLQRLERQTDISATSVTASVRRGRRELLLAGVIGAVGVGALAAYRIVRRPDPIDSLAILPWANLSGDPDADYLSDGITESLINDFAQFGALRVVPRSVVFRYKGQNSDPLKIGQELGCDVAYG